MRNWLIGAAALMLAQTQAEGAVFVDLTQDAAGVSVTTRGSLDLTGLGAPLENSTALLFYPTLGWFNIGPDAIRSHSYPGAVLGPLPSFGTGFFQTASGGTGGRFGVVSSATPSRADLVVPLDYVSGAAIVSTSVFAGASFLGLGFRTGTYTYDLVNGETITMRLGTAPVPVPASLPMALAAFCGLGWIARTRRRR